MCCLVSFYAPTSKKLEGHIASGAFVRPSVCPFVHSSLFLMHSITLVKALRNFGHFYLVSKTSQKLLELRALKLGELIGNDE